MERIYYDCLEVAVVVVVFVVIFSLSLNREGEEMKNLRHFAIFFFPSDARSVMLYFSSSRQVLR